MSTFALAIGLVVGNLIHPGDHLDMSTAKYDPPSGSTETRRRRPGSCSGSSATLVSSLTSGSILQTLFVALLVGFALQAMGEKGAPILTGIRHLQALVFRILAMVMWVAPVGAFGAIAAVVGATVSRRSSPSARSWSPSTSPASSSSSGCSGSCSGSSPASTSSGS